MNTKLNIGSHRMKLKMMLSKKLRSENGEGFEKHQISLVITNTPRQHGGNAQDQNLRGVGKILTNSLHPKISHHPHGYEPLINATETTKQSLDYTKTTKQMSKNQYPTKTKSAHHLKTPENYHIYHLIHRQTPIQTPEKRHYKP